MKFEAPERLSVNRVRPSRAESGDSRAIPAGPDIVATLLLGLLALALFIPSLGYEFLNWDDEMYIHRNAWLLNFSGSNVLGIFRHAYFANYHPLTILSFMVDFQLWGYDPWGYRLGNVVLHALATMAAYGLFRAFGIRRLAAFGAVLLFAVHPLRIESVVWISERKDVLCGVFYLLAMWCWVSGSKPDRGGGGQIVGAVFFFVLALFSKAMAISFPLVVLAHDLFLAPDRVRRRVPLYVFMGALSGVFVWLNLGAQGEAVSSYVPWGERFLMAFYAPLHYSIKTILPMGLSPLYPYESAPFHAVGPAIGGVLFSLVFLVVAVVSIRRAPHLAFGLFAAAIVLGPVSGILPFGAAFAADRYSYLPTVFLLMGIAAAFRRRDLPGDAFAGTIFLAGMLALGTLALMPAWQTSTTLWDRVAVIYPDSQKAKFNGIHARRSDRPATEIVEAAGNMAAIPALGEAGELQVFTLIRENRLPEAAEAAEGMRDPRLSAYWLLRVHLSGGDADAQVRAAQAVLDLEGTTPEQRSWAASALAQNGREEEAVSALESLGEPTMIAPAAWGQLALAAQERGDESSARRFSEKALEIFPAEANAVRVLSGQLSGIDLERLYKRAAHHPAIEPTLHAWTLLQLAKTSADSDALLEEAFSVEPNADASPVERARVYTYIAWLAEESGRIPTAAGLYERALRADPKNLEALQNFAILYLRSGRKTEGIELLERAQKLAPDDEAIAENLRRARE